jgi:hypothetical protein
MSFWGKTYTKLLIPILVVFLTGLSHFGHSLVRKSHEGKTSTKDVVVSSFKSALFQMEYFTVLLFSLFYALILNSLLLPYQCQLQINGTYSLVGSPSENCFTSNWKKNLVLIYVLGFIYVVTFPIVFVIRMVLLQRVDLESKQWKKYAGFTAPYREGAKFWGIVYLVKKACLVISTSLISSDSDPIISYFVSVLFQVFFILVDETVAPYERPSANKVSVM